MWYWDHFVSRKNIAVFLCLKLSKSLVKVLKCQVNSRTLCCLQTNKPNTKKVVQSVVFLQNTASIVQSTVFLAYRVFMNRKQREVTILVSLKWFEAFPQLFRPFWTLRTKGNTLRTKGNTLAQVFGKENLRNGNYRDTKWSLHHNIGSWETAFKCPHS